MEKKNWPMIKEIYFTQKQFSIVQFGSELDRNNVLGNGPWQCDESYVYIQIWVPNFKPNAMDVVEKPFWVHLYNLPIEFWCQSTYKILAAI